MYTYTGSINLNNTDWQDLEAHVGGTDFTPMLVCLASREGVNSGDGPISLEFSDTGDNLFRDVVPLASLDEMGAATTHVVRRAGRLSNGMRVRVRPSRAYGEDALVEVKVCGA